MSLPTDKKIALSFDLEDELYDDPEWFGRTSFLILDLLRRHDAKATFFVTGCILEGHPDIIRRIHQDEHELACHGGYGHKNLHDISEDTFREELERSAGIIERVTGLRPMGFRAPFFSLSPGTEWVLRVLVNLGFKYDSSVFPMNVGKYGVSGAPLSPHRLSKEGSPSKDSCDILEIPVAVYGLGPLRVPIGGGFYFRAMPLVIFDFLVNVVQKQRVPVLYFHMHDFYHGRPKKSLGMIKKGLVAYGVGGALKKLEALLAGRKCDSMRNMFNHDL